MKRRRKGSGEIVIHYTRKVRTREAARSVLPPTRLRKKDIGKYEQREEEESALEPSKNTGPVNSSAEPLVDTKSCIRRNTGDDTALGDTLGGIAPSNDESSNCEMDRSIDR